LDSAIDAVTRDYRAHGDTLHPITVGAVTAVPFGHAVPVLTCAVLRACVIELEPGEKLVNAPIAGDHHRWIIAPAEAGPDGASVLVIVKPTACAISSNLVLSTDRRIYDVDLDAPPCKDGSTNPTPAYTRHLRFYYPDVMTLLTDPRMADSTPSSAPAALNTTRTTVANESSASAEEMPSRNTRYRIMRRRRGPFGLFGHKRPDFPWMPAAIADDGVHLYITMPPMAKQYAAPVLYALEDDGSRSIVNYTMHDSVIVADRVLRRGVLVLANGTREYQLAFENRAWGEATNTARRP
jgi:type IV secretion system protein VirB9